MLREKLNTLTHITLAILFVAATASVCIWQLNALQSTLNRAENTRQAIALQVDTEFKRPPEFSLSHFPSGQKIPPVFGVEETQTPVVLEPESLPQTALNFILRATFTKQDTVNSSALIQTPDEPAIRFYAGDQLTGGVVLQSVHPDAVVLQTQSGLESLFFPSSNLPER